MEDLKTTIPYELKAECVKQCDLMSKQDLYNKVFLPEHKGMSFETFCRKLRRWKNQQFAPSMTLNSGTYGGFTAHGATVQVDKNGIITQAWVKQSAYDHFAEILEAIKADTKPCTVEPLSGHSVESMLEVPLLDMHFGVARLEDYIVHLQRIVSVIDSKQWEQINLIIGQDLIHNNDMRGHTAKGTQIETIDFTQAWKDADSFWQTVINESIKHCNDVHLLYSKGNHDECPAWCFFKMLQAKYPQLKSDDSLNPRKCISWKGCAIGYGHCEYTQNLDKIHIDFLNNFPMEFATAKCKEIHTGHLHRESADNGIMVRRLSSAVPSDEWSRNNGYIGAHKRFQLFEYEPNRLSDIHYV